MTLLPLTPAEQAHLQLLERWRKAVNLVGPGPAEPHFEDAARAVSWLTTLKHASVSPEAGTPVWADLGSGAGFPGVALAARLPGIEVQLVEPRARRAAFLEQVLAQAGLKNASVHRCRSETLNDTFFDGVVSRAYRPPEDYLADAARLLKPGGLALLMLARQEPPQAPGLEVFHVEHYRLPGSGAERERAVVAYQKL
ncbi:MAG: class I SAM-dependent methyltransferase [Alphaproteobacteria bacterium]|nr:class I SAM-dependent methyltransferase [Alphaproteobacteria bacterium]